MDREQALDFCNDLLDSLTVIRGHIQMQMMNKKIDYSLIILDEIDRMVENITKIVMDIKKQQ